MPLYEFECQKCAHVFEVLSAYNAAAPNCPHCGHEKTQRRLSLCAKPAGASPATAPCGESASGCGLGGDSRGGSCCGGSCCGH